MSYRHQGWPAPVKVHLPQRKIADGTVEAGAHVAASITAITRVCVLIAYMSVTSTRCIAESLVQGINPIGVEKCCKERRYQNKRHGGIA